MNPAKSLGHQARQPQCHKNDRREQNPKIPVVFDTQTAPVNHPHRTPQERISGALV